MILNIVILGATGDLAKKKILPAIGELLYFKPENEINLIPWSRNEIDFEIINKHVNQNYHTGFTCENSIVNDYYDVDFLKKFLSENTDKKNVFYLSIPPQYNINFINTLKQIEDKNYQVILEKPYSQNEDEFKKIEELLFKNRLLDNFNFIDHYLFKDSFTFNETVNTFLRKINPKLINNIRVKIQESIGIEERKEFYDKTGCLKDMFFHTFNLYHKILLELSKNFDNNISEEYHIENVIKGQYQSYQEEVSYPSNTETAFQVTFKNNHHFIQVESAKKMEEKITQVDIHLNDNSIITWNIYPYGKIEYFSNTTFMNICLKNSHSDHYNMFEDIIENRKNRFIKIDDILKGWKILTQIEKINTELILY
jgi:glucose-6-phosphate 1-dehydrogenase